MNCGYKFPQVNSCLIGSYLLIFSASFKLAVQINQFLHT